MSEPAQEIEPTQDGLEGEPPEGAEDDHHDPRLTKARNEAKGLRARLREAEQERDGLRTSLSGMQRAEASRLAGEALTDGEDLFRDGVDLTDLLGEDGELDPDQVREAARRVAAAHPNWTPDRSVRSLSPAERPTSQGHAWQDVIKGR